jgi:hypothetical protein
MASLDGTDARTAAAPVPSSRFRTYSRNGRKSPGQSYGPSPAPGPFWPPNRTTGCLLGAGGQRARRVGVRGLAPAPPAQSVSGRLLVGERSCWRPESGRCNCGCARASSGPGSKAIRALLVRQVRLLGGLLGKLGCFRKPGRGECWQGFFWRSIITPLSPDNGPDTRSSVLGTASQEWDTAPNDTNTRQSQEVGGELAKVEAASRKEPNHAEDEPFPPLRCACREP